MKADIPARLIVESLGVVPPPVFGCEARSENQGQLRRPGLLENGLEAPFGRRRVKAGVVARQRAFRRDEDVGFFPDGIGDRARQGFHVFRDIADHRDLRTRDPDSDLFRRGWARLQTDGASHHEGERGDSREGLTEQAGFGRLSTS